MGRGAWRAAALRAAQSQTQLIRLSTHAQESCQLLSLQISPVSFLLFRSFHNVKFRVLDVVSKVFLFFVSLTIPYSIWDLSTLTRNQTYVPCSGSAES